jgi:hypothetical protein
MPLPAPGNARRPVRLRAQKGSQVRFLLGFLLAFFVLFGEMRNGSEQQDPLTITLRWQTFFCERYASVTGSLLFSRFDHTVCLDPRDHCVLWD